MTSARGVAMLLAGVLVCTARADDGGALRLTSPAFTHAGPIPRRFTCEGQDVSPALAWSGVPASATHLALIVEDPDAPDPAAPTRTWVHWVLYDLPAAAGGLAEGVAPAALPAGTRQGTNDWGRTGWGGPCPPIGRHRYLFRLYALAQPLGDLGAAPRGEVVKRMATHIVAETMLTGTYQKRGD